MIVEMREYTLHPGKVEEYFRLYEGEGMDVQKRILGTMVGYYQTEVGELNQVVHLWAYESLDDRERRRAQLLKDPVWQAYVPKIRPMIVSQQTRIMKPAPFFAPALDR